MDMNSRALKRMSLKAWEIAPLIANGVPMPMPQTMNPTWLMRL